MKIVRSYTGKALDLSGRSEKRYISQYNKLPFEAYVSLVQRKDPYRPKWDDTKTSNGQLKAKHSL